MPTSIEQRLDAILTEHGAPDAYPGHVDWPGLRADILALMQPPPAKPSEPCAHPKESRRYGFISETWRCVDCNANLGSLA